MKNFNKLFLTGLALIFIFGFSFAQTAPSAGDGSEGNPYEIGSLDNLYWISQNSSRWDKHFVQTVDINASETETYDGGAGWTPIGNDDTRFTGHYDGNGNKIFGLHINRPSTNNVGLFGHIGNSSDATSIKNLHLLNVSIVGDRGTGSLVGRVTGNQYTRITNCSVESGTIEGTGATGGLVGSHNSYMTNPAAAENFRPGIFNSWANVDVILSSSAGVDEKDKFGGLVGCSQKGLISNSYAFGSVTADNGKRIGGLAGCILSRGIIINSFSTGVVSGENADDIGGLVGMVGIGSHSGSVSNSFWDTESSNMAASEGGTGKTTSEMQQETTFTDAGWDFSTVWNIDGETNSGYPFLMEAFTPSQTWTWKTNAETNEWNSNTNWVGDPATAPTDNAEVVIPAGITGEHPILSNNVTVYCIDIGENATLTINEGYTLTINNTAKGKGTIEGAGVLRFEGNIPQEIPGFTFNYLELNNINNANLAENITITGELTMTAGLLDLNGHKIILNPNAVVNETKTSRIFGTAGTIETTRTITEPAGENIGGMGLAITTSKDLGETTIIRGHTEQLGENESASILRYFDILPQNNADLDATLVFHYFFEELNGQDQDNLVLYKKEEESLWEKFDTNNDEVNFTLSAINIPKFSRWTASNSDSNPLPVTWLYFDGKRHNETSVMLTWSTAVEINNKGFEIQRSMDANTFTTIGYQAGIGNSTQIQNYNYIDHYALDATVYYRIKQIDFDGKYDYSKNIAVENIRIFDEFKMYPNPSKHDIFILFPQYDGTIKAVVTDITGKQVYSTEIENSHKHHINISDWNNGIYIISLENRGKVLNRKIIKQ